MSLNPEPSSTERIDAVLRGEPPVEGATLSGWVTFCEWTKSNGERILTLLGKPDDNLTQLKGYVHSGLLRMAWKEYGDTRPARPATRPTGS